LNVADVSTGVSCKLDRNGFVGKSWTRKLKMGPVWFPTEGRIEAKVEPSAGE
jgi:hypothetical protein